jgi:large subunit ribosomal protein L15
VLRYEPNYFGKRGFTSPKSLLQKDKVINVGELESLADKLALKNQLEKREEKAFIDLEKLGYTKLLGMGKIVTPILVKIGSYSESAAKKIEEAGGKIITKQN